MNVPLSLNLIVFLIFFFKGTGVFCWQAWALTIDLFINSVFYVFVVNFFNWWTISRFFGVWDRIVHITDKIFVFLIILSIIIFFFFIIIINIIIHYVCIGLVNIVMIFCFFFFSLIFFFQLEARALHHEIAGLTINSAPRSRFQP